LLVSSEREPPAFKSVRAGDEVVAVERGHLPNRFVRLDPKREMMEAPHHLPSRKTEHQNRLPVD
jgi:hypothetical protein